MWPAIRGAIAFVFGDDIVKYTLYAVGGLVIFIAFETVGVSQAIFSQPFGQWWLAGQMGAASVSVPITTNQTPQPVQTPGPRQTLIPVPTVIVELNRIQDIINKAYSYVQSHTPYLWGGCSYNGIDCSCMTENSLAAGGITAPRTTVQQIAWAKPIDKSQLQPADLVFFNNTCQNCGPNPTHVGLYIGDGNMIDAGDPVTVEPVFSGFMGAHYAASGRPQGL